MSGESGAEEEGKPPPFRPYQMTDILAPSVTIDILVDRALRLPLVAAPQSSIGEASAPSCFVTFDVKGNRVDEDGFSSEPMVLNGSDTCHTPMAPYTRAPVWNSICSLTFDTRQLLGSIEFSVWHLPVLGNSIAPHPSNPNLVEAPSNHESAQILGVVAVDISALHKGLDTIDGWYHIKPNPSYCNLDTIGQLKLCISSRQPMARFIQQPPTPPRGPDYAWQGRHAQYGEYSFIGGGPGLPSGAGFPGRDVAEDAASDLSPRSRLQQTAPLPLRMRSPARPESLTNRPREPTRFRIAPHDLESFQTDVGELNMSLSGGGSPNGKMTRSVTFSTPEQLRLANAPMGSDQQDTGNGPRDQQLATSPVKEYHMVAAGERPYVSATFSHASMVAQMSPTGSSSGPMGRGLPTHRPPSRSSGGASGGSTPRVVGAGHATGGEDDTALHSRLHCSLKELEVLQTDLLGLAGSIPSYGGGGGGQGSPTTATHSSTLGTPTHSAPTHSITMQPLGRTHPTFTPPTRGSSREYEYARRSHG